MSVEHHKDWEERVRLMVCYFQCYCYCCNKFSHFILFLLIALYLDQIIQSSPGRPPSLGQKGDPPSRRAWHSILRWWELDVAKSLSFWLEPMPKAQTFGCRQCQDLKCLAVTIAKSFHIILRLWHSSISWGPSRRHWGAVQVAEQFKGFFLLLFLDVFLN